MLEIRIAGIGIDVSTVGTFCLLILNIMYIYYIIIIVKSIVCI